MLQPDKLCAFLSTGGLGMDKVSSFQKGQIGKKKGEMCPDQVQNRENTIRY